MLVIGFQFIFGHAGAVSLAQSSFFGLGGYVTGVLGATYRVRLGDHVAAVDSRARAAGRGGRGAGS